MITALFLTAFAWLWGFLIALAIRANNQPRRRRITR